MKTLIKALHFLAIILVATVYNAIQLTSPGYSPVSFAIVQNPITGDTRGAFSTAIFSKWFNKFTMRSKPVSVRQKNSPAQLDQRAKFALVQHLCSSLLTAIRNGFSEYAIEFSAYNEAMSRNLIGAISGSSPNFAIDYENVQLSDGSQAPVPDAAVTSPSAFNLLVQWSDNSAEPNAEAADPVTIAVYCSEFDYAVYNSGALTREAESVEIGVPLSWGGKRVQVYAIASDISTKVKSITIHAGEVVVTS